ncbi:hypothetical protein GH714_037993 [Hevea brasiliensis]|uniref:NAC domain-containing protein n=1 Tax=Hevea brasiliensis TaxID=3981 RepID=A0A6A6KN53_HEVBR|nr:hypothetical protein GH714_037993 [Hevea brasiliensis]
MEDLHLLPPGFRFYPTEEELLSFYLHHKLEGKREDLNQVMDRVIPVLDVYDFNPWDLPQLCGDYCHGDQEQWFFLSQGKKGTYGGRPNRLTAIGYWKSTGSPSFVYSSNNCCIGVKRTMVFYEGRVPNGRKTDWKMNEYKAILQGGASSSATAHSMLRAEFCLCRIYKKAAKCRRSFDRRPLGVGVETGQRTDEQGRGGEEIAITHQNPPMIEGKCSLESSFSGEQLLLGYNDSQTEEISNMPTASENDQLLWDWEKLDWCNNDGEDIIFM